MSRIGKCPEATRLRKNDTLFFCVHIVAEDTILLDIILYAIYNVDMIRSQIGDTLGSEKKKLPANLTGKVIFN